MNSETLVKMEVVHLIKFADKFAGIEVHLHVSGKNVKLNYSTDHFIDILRKLQQKDVNEVLIKESDCKLILQNVSEALSSKNFYNPQTVQEKRVETLSSSMITIKNVIGQIGVDQESMKLLKTINDKSMALLKESPSIFSFVNDFRKNCAEEYLLSVLNNYLMGLVIDQFDWKSDLVKYKASLASIMCDMTLSKNDFIALRKWQRDGGELPENIWRHPQEVAEKLKTNRLHVPMETINIIEQHHELPDGRGFPNGVTGSRINQLSAIFIICQKFVENLHDNEYNYEKRSEIIEKIQIVYGGSRIFEKAINALVKIVS